MRAGRGGQGGAAGAEARPGRVEIPEAGLGPGVSEGGWVGAVCLRALLLGACFTKTGCY